MPHPDGGIQVTRRGSHGNTRVHADRIDWVCSYASVEHWAPCQCGQTTVTRRSDMSWGCCRCGRTRTREAA